MRRADLVKITARRVAELHGCLHLEPVSADLLDGDPSTAAFLELLLDKRNYRDAVRVLAHALPSREAVWWACVCARSATAGVLPGDDMRLLMAVETWVYSPTLDNRRQVSRAMRDADPTGPVAFVGAAVASTHTDLQPPGNGRRTIDRLRGMAVAGAIMLSALCVEPDRQIAAYGDFLRRGVEIASGGTGN